MLRRTNDIPVMTTRAERMHAALTEAFAPAALSIRDDSGQHAGHAGARPEGETHYSVLMVSARFAGLGRVARSRVVHEVLRPEFDCGLHALSLRLLTPEEADAPTAAR
jgi:BolA protein